MTFRSSKSKHQRCRAQWYLHAVNDTVGCDLAFTIRFPSENPCTPVTTCSSKFYLFFILFFLGQDEDKLVGILTVGQIFGFCQGLYDCRPHPNSYKARSACEILLLRRESWLDLMLFYDAQTMTVYKRACKLPYEYRLNTDYLGWMRNKPLRSRFIYIFEIKQVLSNLEHTSFDKFIIRLCKPLFVPLI